jgi:hypothetical protein
LVLALYDIWFGFFSLNALLDSLILCCWDHFLVPRVSGRRRLYIINRARSGSKSSIFGTDTLYCSGSYLLACEL